MRHHENAPEDRQNFRRVLPPLLPSRRRRRSKGVVVGIVHDDDDDDDDVRGRPKSRLKCAATI